MKKHPTKKEEKRIQSFLKDFEYAFGLQNYDRTISFPKENYKDNAARVEIQEDYQRIQIYIYPSFFDVDQTMQREYLLHEFCHYLTDPICTVAWNLSNGKFVTDEIRRMENEKSTSRTTNLIDKLLTDKMQFAKKAYKQYLKK